MYPRNAAKVSSGVVLLVLATLSFWFVRVDNILAIFFAFMDAGRCGIGSAAEPIGVRNGCARAGLFGRP